MTYVALLRGINIRGHHKVPMGKLRNLLEKIELTDISTLLNSGNVIFNAEKRNTEQLEIEISNHLESFFDFSIPVVVIQKDLIDKLYRIEPFQGIDPTKAMRLFVTFLKKDQGGGPVLPWNSPDHSFKILEKIDQCVISVLDMTTTKSPKGMQALENFYGREITTRNWNTVIRLRNKLNAPDGI